MKKRTHAEHIAVMQGRHFNLLFYNMLDVFIPHATRHTHIANKMEPPGKWSASWCGQLSGLSALTALL